MRWPQLWPSEPQLHRHHSPAGPDTPDRSTGPDAPALPTAGARHKGSTSSSGGQERDRSAGLWGRGGP